VEVHQPILEGGEAGGLLQGGRHLVLLLSGLMRMRRMLLPGKQLQRGVLFIGQVRRGCLLHLQLEQLGIRVEILVPL
jgi:hypothetical protein